MKNIECDFLRTHRFYVELPEKMNLPEFLVKSCSRPLNEETLTLKLYDSSTHNIIDILNKYKENDTTGQNIVIHMLNEDDKTKRKDTYLNVVLSNFELNDLDIDNPDYSLFTLRFFYSDIKHQ